MFFEVSKQQFLSAGRIKLFLSVLKGVLSCQTGKYMINCHCHYTGHTESHFGVTMRNWHMNPTITKTNLLYLTELPADNGQNVYVSICNTDILLNNL